LIVHAPFDEGTRGCSTRIKLAPLSVGLLPRDVAEPNGPPLRSITAALAEVVIQGRPSTKDPGSGGSGIEVVNGRVLGIGTTSAPGGSAYVALRRSGFSGLSLALLRQHFGVADPMRIGCVASTPRCTAAHHHIWARGIGLDGGGGAARVTCGAVARRSIRHRCPGGVGRPRHTPGTGN
jgi:hypothetical protein